METRRPDAKGQPSAFTNSRLPVCSFSGDEVYAPKPDSKRYHDPAAKLPNQHHRRYAEYLSRLPRPNRGENRERYCGRVADLERVSYIEWLRQQKAGKQGGRGRGSKKRSCAVSVRFSFELLDIFIGQWCAMFVPHFQGAADVGSPWPVVSTRVACPDICDLGSIARMLDISSTGLTTDELEAAILTDPQCLGLEAPQG